MDVAVGAACTAFSGAVQGDLNMALVRLIEKLSMFSGTENIVVRTLLPIVRKDTLNDFMESCGLNDIVKEAKGLIKNVSTLREEVLKTSRTKSFAMMTKDHSKKEKEKEQRSAEKEEVMSGEEIYKNGLKSAETLKALFERARGLAIADLQGKFAEIWNFFVSALRALKTVKKMQSMVSKVASLNVKSEVMNGRSKYEESVTELLGEFKGCVASPYIPDYEDKIRALQKECDELRAKNAELKTKLMNG